MVRASTSTLALARAALVWAALAVAAPAPATVVEAAAAATARLADASADKVEASVVIPDAVRKVGEVRLLSRGGAVVVQTLLSTRLLSRVIAEIRIKEGRNWPADDESVRAYLAALDSARVAVEKRDPGLEWKERRRRLLIEFAADATDAVVLVGTFRTADDAKELTVTEREVFSTLVLPRAFILKEIRLILADSFKVDEKDVDRLGPLGPSSAVPNDSTPAAASTASPPAVHLDVPAPSDPKAPAH